MRPLCKLCKDSLNTMPSCHVLHYILCTYGDNVMYFSTVSEELCPRADSLPHSHTEKPHARRLNKVMDSSRWRDKAVNIKTSLVELCPSTISLTSSNHCSLPARRTKIHRSLVLWRDYKDELTVSVMALNDSFHINIDFSFSTFSI